MAKSKQRPGRHYVPISSMTHLEVVVYVRDLDAAHSMKTQVRAQENAGTPTCEVGRRTTAEMGHGSLNARSGQRLMGAARVPIENFGLI